MDQGQIHRKENLFRAVIRKGKQHVYEFYRDVGRRLSGNGPGEQELTFCVQVLTVILMLVACLLTIFMIAFGGQYLIKFVIRPMVTILYYFSLLFIPLHNISYYTIGPWRTRALCVALFFGVKFYEWGRGFSESWVHMFQLLCLIILFLTIRPDIEHSSIFGIMLYRWAQMTLHFFLDMGEILLASICLFMSGRFLRSRI